ncbi:YpfN family protein [Photorhabdus sp. SF281]|uniref:YpfN family protein n=1 Tax=Photorhabdus sp. SF281 TaxID=3459527 RepID=UPI004043CF31
MQWLADYWWIILVLLVGVLLNAIKELRRLDVKKFLDNKPELPPHRDFNDKWDEKDDWPQKKQ